MTNTNDLKKLIQDLSELVKFHELEAVDLKAVELLQQVDSVEIPEQEIDTEFADHLEAIRKDNISPLAP